MLTVALVIVAVVCAAWAIAMHVRSRNVVTVVVEQNTVNIDHVRHEQLWALYRHHLGGVTDRFMSWCDAMAEAGGNMDVAIELHRQRYPDSFGELPITDDTRDLIVERIVDDLRQIEKDL